LISSTTLVSTYKTVHEPIQQHSGPLQQLVTVNCVEPPSPLPRVQKSAVLSEAKFSLSIVVAVGWYLFESFDVVVGRSGEEQIIIFNEHLRVIPTLFTE